jgi:hypothetical protein
LFEVLKSEEQMPEETLTNQRRAEILDWVMARAFAQLCANGVIRAIENGDWANVIAENETPDGPLDKLYQGGYATEEELTELAKPHLAKMLAKAIGARQVAIEW